MQIITDVDDKRTNNQSGKIFDEYMINALQRSSDYTQRMVRQGYNAIQLLLTLLTALTGGLIIVITTVGDQFLTLLLVTLLVGFAAAFCALTYMWILALTFQEKRERIVRFFLEKYFRDINPFLYEKYGLSELYGLHNGIKQQQNFLPADEASFLSLLALAIFSSLLLSISIYTGWLAITNLRNVLLPVTIGTIFFIVLFAIERYLQKQIKKEFKNAQIILQTYHSEGE